MSTDPVRIDLRATASLAFSGTLLYAAVRFAGAYLEAYAMAGAMVQAVMAEWGSGRLGIVWSDPMAKTPTARAIALRALRGAGMGLGAALVGLGLLLVTHGGTLAPNVPSIPVALVGLIAPLTLAARDELLLRGLVLRVLPTRTVTPAKLFFCGAASAAAAYGDGATLVPALLAAGLGGVAFGALWLRDRGAWLAWGAHAGFMWAAGPLSKGGLVDLRAAATSWGGGDAGVASGWAAVAITAVVSAAAIAMQRAAPTK